MILIGEMVNELEEPRLGSGNISGWWLTVGMRMK
jgi:hypothetical protein